ncbi:hypothetical protein SCHPADRAFT_293540 [Schizopora paradoxa]|uniref:histone acetyltransferase n=1 Tax=Schizopora paradoxa TaxID=27342 RepID=A0A0H2RZ56_9AGAM|nr:hypothetical protein SCHPADRAFT_293540 [Schizopora paradoxa]
MLQRLTGRLCKVQKGTASHDKAGDAMNLRDHLLKALATLPGSRTFHLHVLLSSPRKFSGLYPYATPTTSGDRKQRRPPRVYAQDVLIVVSEEVLGQRVLVLAVEAGIFNIPYTKSTVVSIVKVDTTARGKRPAPTTAIMSAFISFFTDPATRPQAGVERVWVHLFARSQGQYLFPNSSEFEGKKVLSPEKLCKWWKTVLSGVTGAGARYWWLIPGLDEEEALQAIGELHAGASQSSRTPGQWTYGHPYAQKEVPLPYVQDETATPYNLGHFIPSFDDDPKTRFMDEIACTTQVEGVLSPKRKRPKTSKQADASSSQGRDDEEEVVAKEREKETRPHGELGKVGTDEFWERMSFRQECISGALTGFFVAVFPCPSRSSASSNPLAPEPGQVSFQMNRRVLMSMRNTDFASIDGAIRGTEILENAIRGMCEGTALSTATTITTTTSTIITNTASAETDAPPRLETSDLPPPSFDRRTPERETKRSQLAPPGNVHDDISPNPFPEPVASTDTYQSFIYGSITTENREETAGSSAQLETRKVTELAVRKKVKRK